MQQTTKPDRPPSRAARSLLLAGLWGLSACGVSTTKRTTEQIIPVAPGTALHLTATARTVRVVAGRPGHVRVRTIRSVRALRNRGALLKQIEVDVQKQGSTLRIKATHPKSKVGRKFQLRLIIEVPPRTPVTVRLARGALRLSRLRGDIRAETGRGDLTARDVTGTVTLRTAEGNITLRGRPPTFQLDTKLGDVNLVLREGTKLTGPCSAKTARGAITLSVPPSLSATLTASTQQGSIRSALPLQTKKPTWVRTVLGPTPTAGSPPELTLSTVHGDVRLKRLQSWRPTVDKK